jgi:hypothetical protein
MACGPRSGPHTVYCPPHWVPIMKKLARPLLKSWLVSVMDLEGSLHVEFVIRSVKYVLGVQTSVKVFVSHNEVNFELHAWALQLVFYTQDYTDKFSWTKWCYEWRIKIQASLRSELLWAVYCACKSICIQRCAEIFECKLSLQPSIWTIQVSGR